MGGGVTRYATRPTKWDLPSPYEAPLLRQEEPEAAAVRALALAASRLGWMCNC